MTLFCGRTAVSALVNSDARQLTTGLLAIASTTAVISLSAPSISTKNESKGDQSTKLEVYLMDKIAKKPYLNNSSIAHSSSSHDPRKYYKRISDDTSHTAMDIPRPKGIPSRLRILAIDVPQCKTDAFRDGICQQPSKVFEGSVDPVFRDGVARSKRIHQNTVNESHSRKEKRESRRPIEQKSLAKMLYYCYGKQTNLKVSETDEWEPIIGVEILEASVMNLNPNNIKRTYTPNSKSSYRHDPEKYNNVSKDKLQRHETGSSIADIEEIANNDGPGFADSEEDEDDIRTAPWNQYAWLEEMHLRINGLVPFNAPMQRSSVFSHNIFGRAYQQTVPSSMPFLRRLFPWTLWGSNTKSVEGIDGEGECIAYADEMRNFEIGRSQYHGKLNRASNKPHAVIVNGSAVQRVPGSLRFLTKVCRDADVPLYILNDPRSWGRLSPCSYSSLDEALADLRKTVTNNVISNALKLREGSAFERGRLVGRWEKELEWQARDAGRKTRQTWLDAKQRWKRERMEDWSELNEMDLRVKFAEKKVLNGEDDYSDGLRNVCKRCVNQEPKKSTE